MNDNDPMNKNTPSHSGADYQEDAVLLTASALGQLDGSEQAEAERLLAGPGGAAAREHVAEVRTVAAALQSVRNIDHPPRSASLRRTVLAAAARATVREDVTPHKPAPLRPWARGRFNRWLLAGGGVTAAVAVAFGMQQVAQHSQLAYSRAVRVSRDGDIVSASRQMPRAKSEVIDNSSGFTNHFSGGTISISTTGAAGVNITAIDRLSDTTESFDSRSITNGPGRSDTLTGERGLPFTNTGDGILGVEDLAGLNLRLPTTEAVADLADGIQHGTSIVEHGKRMAQHAVDEKPLTGPNPLVRSSALTISSTQRAGQAPDDGRKIESESARDGYVSGEQYGRIEENRFLRPSDQPLSTFSIDVDTASYANVRRFLSSGQLPPRDAVRIEELINYFRYDYPQPAKDEPFSVTVESAACPWHEGRRLVRIGLQGRDIDRRERPPGNLVFLVDVSGSMDEANKLPLVKQALSLLVEELTENDRVAIVTYAGNAGLALPSTSGDQKQKIHAAIDALSSGGSTHGSAGINLAYEQAAERFITGGVNRVILATDGDLNVGVTSDEALVDLIKAKAAGGTFLTVLGFGQGNLQDAKMEKLADNGNGVYAYIDGLREARKVLVEQLTGSTITIAKDMKIQVEFNPAQVASYRLLGYENRILAAADFRNDRKDAGEIGAGHSVTALYEIAIVGDGGGPVTGAEPLKYQPQLAATAPVPPPIDGEANRELLTVKLRWKQPDGDASTLKEVSLSDRGGAFEAASTDMRFAVGVVAFGMILRGSEHKGEATLPFVAKIASSAVGPDVGGYRAEFIDLVRKAESCPSPR